MLDEWKDASKELPDIGCLCACMGEMIDYEDKIIGSHIFIGKFKFIEGIGQWVISSDYDRAFEIRYWFKLPIPKRDK